MSRFVMRMRKMRRVTWWDFFHCSWKLINKINKEVMMRVSEVNITFIKPKDSLVGFASIVLDDAIYLSSIGIHKKLNGGYRLTFPSKKSGQQQFQIFHPIRKGVSEKIEQAIFDKLKDVMNHAGYNCTNSESTAI